MLDPATIDALVAVAAAARERAHAPYSRFRVGAAVVDAAGRMTGGCNVENASYGLTTCAEQVALYRAVAEGMGPAVAMAVVGEGEAAVPPCGLCRQVMVELCDPQARIVLAPLSGPRSVVSLDELLPFPFTAKFLVRREDSERTQEEHDGLE